MELAFSLADSGGAWNGPSPASMEYIYIYICVYCGGACNGPSPASMGYIYIYIPIYIYIYMYIVAGLGMGHPQFQWTLYLR